jgi:hypothetical protein
MLRKQSLSISHLSILYCLYLSMLKKKSRKIKVCSVNILFYSAMKRNTGYIPLCRKFLFGMNSASLHDMIVFFLASFSSSQWFGTSYLFLKLLIVFINSSLLGDHFPFKWILYQISTPDRQPSMVRQSALDLVILCFSTKTTVSRQ